MSGWTIGGILVSVALGAMTPIVWRRRGPKFGIRWLSFALLPVGLALAGLLKLGNEFAKFVSKFVFSPTAWVGWAVIALAVGLWFAARLVAPKDGEAGPKRKGVGSPATQLEPSRAAPTRKSGKSSASSGDGEFDDIEEMLRRRGIS